MQAWRNVTATCCAVRHAQDQARQAHLQDIAITFHNLFRSHSILQAWHCLAQHAKRDRMQLQQEADEQQHEATNHAAACRFHLLYVKHGFWQRWADAVQQSKAAMELDLQHQARQHSIQRFVQASCRLLISDIADAVRRHTVKPGSVSVLTKQHIHSLTCQHARQLQLTSAILGLKRQPNCTQASCVLMTFLKGNIQRYQGMYCLCRKLPKGSTDRHSKYTVIMQARRQLSKQLLAGHARLPEITSNLPDNLHVCRSDSNSSVMLTRMAVMAVWTAQQAIVWMQQLAIRIRTLMLQLTQQRGLQMPVKFSQRASGLQTTARALAA